MRTMIKICGLSTPKSMQAALSEGADYVGLIFFEKSPRNVSLETAASLADIARGKARIVAVTVNAGDDFLDAMVAAVRPDFLQLHGSETPQRTSDLRNRFSLPVIKAFAVREAADFARLGAYQPVADMYLLDAKAPEGSDLPGGNGVSFDWNLLTGLADDTDYMLSGGLNADNIREALEISGANAVDVSSGVEAAPGMKDIAKISSFIQTVRDYDQSRKSAA